jgi:hypothetical protein
MECFSCGTSSEWLPCVLNPCAHILCSRCTIHRWECAPSSAIYCDDEGCGKRVREVFPILRYDEQAAGHAGLVRAFREAKLDADKSKRRRALLAWIRKDDRELRQRMKKIIADANARDLRARRRNEIQ